MDRAGAETMMMNYLRNIDRDKIQMDFLINREEKSDYEEEIKSLGSHIYHMSPLYPGKFIGYKREFKRFLQQHPEYKIIHSNLEERSYFALKIAKKLGVPVRIVHAHSVPREHNLKMLVRLYFRKRLRKYYTHALTCGKKPARWLFGTDEKAVIMKNAIDTRRFQFDAREREEMRKQFGIAKKTLLVGNIGRFSPEKNQGFLLNVFQEIHKKNSDSMLIFIGGGKPKIEQKIKKELVGKAKRLGLESNIKFLGVKEHIEKWMQMLDVIVMPSISEGFPVTLVEAQAAGVRCAVSEGVSPEVNITGELQYNLLSESAETWAKNILSLCETEPDRKNMHEKIIEAGLDIRENAGWLETFYEKALEESTEYFEKKQSKNQRNFMKLIKLWCRMKAVAKKFIYKVLFGKKLKIGKGTTWRHGFHIAIEGNGKIEIGRNCFFNNYCSINSLEHIIVGDGTIFGENCHVYDHNHKFRSSETAIKNQGYTVAQTKIGKHCWLGTGAIILKGVTIGDNCVIGAGCVVKENLPDNSILNNNNEITSVEQKHGTEEIN